MNDGIEMSATVPVETFIYGPVLNYSIECADCKGGFEGTGIVTLQNKITDISD